MDIKEVEKEYCSRCPFYKYGCGFITRGLQDKCVQLSDYTDGYERGYHQAEKDLELTWEDLKMLDEISDQVYAECDVDAFDEKEYYQEVLKRFKERKDKL